MSQCRSFSNNYRSCSQNRKISIGVLVDSIGKAEKKNIKKTEEVQITENGTSTKGNCVKEHEGQSPLVEKHVTVEQKDTSPWVSTRSINPNIPSSVAVHDTEHTPSFLGTRRTRPRSKLLEKASAAHSLKFFSGKTGSESNKDGQKNFGKPIYSMETGKVNNAKRVENLASSTEPGVLSGKEQVEDKDGKTEITGRETLRMKLWEILGNVSSPNKNCGSPQSVELQPDQERDEKHHPVEKRNPNSDTIESDSEKQTSRRPTTRSLTRKKASTKNQHKKIEATKCASHRKECPRKRIFSFRGDYSGKLYDNFDDGSSHSKRNKINRGSSGLETHQDKYENAEERHQSENKSRSKPAVQKSMFNRTEGFIANSSNDGRNVIFFDPKSGTEKTNSFEPPPNVMTEQQDVEQQKNMEYPNLKDQHVDIAGSLLKTKRNSVNHPSTPPFEIKSPVCSPKNNREKLHGHSPAEKEFNMKGIRRFRSLLNPKSAECKPNVQAESSDGTDELNGSLHMKPSFIMEEDSGNLISNSSNDATDSERSEDDSRFRESEKLYPEVCTAEKFACAPDTNLDNEKDIEVTGCSPASESLKGIQENGELEMHLKENQEDGLASAVALFTIALGRVKAKLMSMSSKRSAEIMRAASEEIFSLLQNAESQIKIDVGKLTNLSQSKRKWLESKFQEQQDQLLGIHKRFKEEVDLHLQNYSSVIEDLEEHEAELKRTIERKRANQKKNLSHVEQEIQVQLDCAESRIMAVQELARKKMMQLKVVVAESIKHGAFG